MERLRQSDLRTLLLFLRNCYAFRGFESYEQFVRHFVASLTQLVPANAAFYMETDVGTSDSYQLGSESYVETPEAIAAWSRYGREHPPALHVMRTGESSALSISQFWSSRQFRSTRLYSELYRPFGIYDDLAMPICFGSPVTVVGWHGDRRFTARERLLANFASPHIIQTWQNANSVKETFYQLQLLKQGVESESSGVISCDDDGRSYFTTALARRYLLEYFGVSRKLDRQLPDELVRWMRIQNLQLLEDGVPSVRRPFVVHRANKRLIVRLLSNDGLNLLSLEERRLSSNIDGLRTFGLSRREFEVLVWVAQGKTNSEIASILSMNSGTVKKHLVHIFQKLGVETRTAAAAFVLSSRPPS